MKLYICQTSSGNIKKMSFSKVIKNKRAGKQVKIIGVEVKGENK